MTENNTLSIAIYNGHSALRLNCSSCDDGKPHYAVYGIYSIEDLRPQAGHMIANGEWFSLLMLISSAYTCEVRDDSYMFNQQSQSKIVDIPINNKQAINALQEIIHTTEACKSESYFLRPVNNNCADFIQRVFVTTELTGHFGDYFSDKMLLDKIDDMSAYIYISSRGVAHAWTVGNRVWENMANQARSFDDLVNNLKQLQEGNIPKGDFEFIKVPCYKEVSYSYDQGPVNWVSEPTMTSNTTCLLTEFGLVEFPNNIDFTSCYIE